MTKRTFATAALTGTALTLSLAGSAGAATQIDLNRDIVPNLNDQCQALVQEIRARNNKVPDEHSQMVVEALNNDNAQACGEAEQTLASAPQSGQEDRNRDQAQADASDSERRNEQASASDSARETASDRETAEVSERVRIEEEATIEGQAAVIVPDPNVDVAVDGPQVTVQKAQPEVTVQENAAQIQVEQPQPNVSVDIPEIVVRVEIPAPSIYVQTDDPTVNVASGDPKVDVQQSEPRVTVKQPDPKLKVDLGVDGDGETRETAEQGESGQGDSDMMRGGDVNIASNEPQVDIKEAQGEPNISVQSADPQVNFEGSKPKVSVNFTQEPTVEIAQMGEPEVTFETAEEREARLNEQESQRQQASNEGQQQRNDRQAQAGEDGEQQQTDRAMAENQEGQQQGNRQTAQGQSGEQQSGQQQADAGQNSDQGGQAAGDARIVQVSDLLGMDVIGAQGENLDEPEALIQRNGKMMLVIEEGGFLGLGENQVAVPLERVIFHEQDRELRLQELTEDEIEEARNFEYDASEEVEGNREVRIK